jgi:cytochrome c peroxidase
MGVGGHTFQKFGVREYYWKVTGVAALDKGRFEVTKDPSDLWNGEMTASGH